MTRPKGGIDLAAFPRSQVANALRGLFGLEGVEVVDLDVVLRALRRVEATSLDWVDCLLLAHSSECPVYTFDQEVLAAGGLSPMPQTEA